MKAVVFEAVDQVGYREVEKPVPEADEVLIHVEAAGLCGSDFHILHGTYPAKYPLIPGHEFSGTIAAVGSRVEGWEIGTRVTADPNIYCNSCYYCLRDQKNMCEHAEASGVTRNGGFAEYVAVPVSQIYQLPDSVSFEEGAFVEPMACVSFGMKRLNLRFGDRAVVFGAGPMGLLLLKALKAGGASLTAVVDLEDTRLETAKKLGAAATYHNVSELIADYPKGFDAVIDATGNAKVIESMFQAAAKRAKILQFGCADSDAKVTINPFDLYNNDWEYIGTRTAVFTYQQAIDMLASRAITGEGIINDVIGLSQLPDYLTGGKPASSLKVIVKPGQ